VSAEPSDERVDSDDAAAPESSAADDADRSYEQQVLDELVPEISVGDDATNTEPDEYDAEPTEDFGINEDAGLADALGELDEELQQAFIRIVVGIKAGVLLISAGILVIGFRGMTVLGGALIAVGCLAFVRAGYRYWKYEQTDDSDYHNN